MNIVIRKFNKNDICPMIEIWNDIVEEGIAFPQTEMLDADSGLAFFLQQSFTGVAEDIDSNEILGLYILHPNNVGRCGHISNASYGVKKGRRGLHIGEKLVSHCLQKAKELGFRILQFNAVVSINYSALHLYEKLGFVKLGIIPEGFLMRDGTYQDIIPHYRSL
ncbi:acetyltransferase (GNAT) family protein [Oxobacter pfennigii]|uniref:Acetyltransferase (GNAT) family protein n=1 Tax=Oxobacter pfennigii TaxID=36849 RepID=A0A0P9AKF7_9CLOT|nr:GNAT family N-acetyltransferase [Oxobacter pfennigii]KPU45829.1 acetyltransferase (GNAT) family protein [Oxobacter pfennigii]